MIILSWNIRGLNARVKRSNLRKLVLSHKPNIIFIQETKMESITNKTLKSIWNDDQSAHSFSPSLGSSGGILSLWEKNFFVMEHCQTSRNWIALCGKIRDIDFRCCLINIYNSCELEDRAQTWSDIREFRDQMKVPCLIYGDFNEVTNNYERGSLLASQRGMDDFNNFIQDTQMIEVSPSNGFFTWHRGASKSKLDRLLINPEWLATFPHLQTFILKRNLSDHNPLITTSSQLNWGPKPFRFQNAWLSHPGCEKIIAETWRSAGGN